MIFHDRVDVWMQVDTGETDMNGFPIIDWVETPNVPGEVFPLDTDHQLSASRDIVISRYRMLLAPQVDIPPDIGNNLRLSWNVFTFTESSPTSGLRVDGSVERHMVRGRLRHYELIVRRELA